MRNPDIGDPALSFDSISLIPVARGGRSVAYADASLVIEEGQARDGK